jgi:hypothetical protein
LRCEPIKKWEQRLKITRKAIREHAITADSGHGTPDKPAALPLYPHPLPPTTYHRHRMSASALRHTDGTMTVVLDNVQDPAHSGPTTLRLGLGASFGAGRKVALTAGGLGATTGITLGGQTVSADGHLASPRSTPVQVGGNTLTISVPAGTAEILTLTLTPTHSPRR